MAASKTPRKSKLSTEQIRERRRLNKERREMTDEQLLSRVFESFGGGTTEQKQLFGDAVRQLAGTPAPR